MALNQPVDSTAGVSMHPVILTDGRRDLARLVGELLAEEWYRKVSAARRRETPVTADEEKQAID